MPIFSWSTSPDGPILSPLVSLPVFALALIGLFSTTKGFFASRNSIATLLLIFTVVITGFNPSSVVFIIIPLSILVAHGLKYVLEKWYGLFPENPYARISALIPLSILFAIIILPNIRALAFLKKPAKTPEGYHLSRIITSEKSDNSDIIYLYTVEGE